MKILWISDPPTAPSGYGQQAALFIPRLRAAGHDVALFALGGSTGAYRPSDALRSAVYPTVADPRGNDVVALHAKDFQADVVLTLGDPHVFDLNVYGNLPWLAWAPTDFIPPTKATLASLSVTRWVWSPSKVGALAYIAAGPLNARHVPHGVDSRIFCSGSKSTARGALSRMLKTNIDESVFLVAMVAANKGTPSRKGFYEAFAAFKAFSDGHPEARLYLHTEITGLAGGEDLREIMRLVGLDTGRVLYPDQYEYLTGRLSPWFLASVYRAADVYLSTSHGEGFGLPLIEAQLCGCPVIAPDNTAQSELLGVQSWHVSCAPYHPFDGGTLWYRPNVEEIVHALDLASQTTVDGAKLRADVMSYDVDRVFVEHMQPALGEIAEEIRS